MGVIISFYVNLYLDVNTVDDFLLCVLSMSQVAMSTTSTTLSETVVCSGALLITTTVMLAPTSVGLITLDQQDVVLLLQLIPRDMMRGSAGLTNVPQLQQPQSQMPSQAYANYAMGQVCKFLLKNRASHQLLCHMFCVCYGVCFLLSGSHVTAMLTYGASTIGVCDTSTLWRYPW